MNTLLKRIAVDPHDRFGAACVLGTQIRVSVLLESLASGMTIEQILKKYSKLKREDILAAVAYGTEMSRGRFVDLPGQEADKVGIIEVKNWQDLVNLEEEKSLNGDKEWIYRGQPDSRWRLRSTLERAFEDFKVQEGDMAYIETRILMDFQRSCHVYAPAAVPEKEDIMAWYALMRHYGAPTRMLDFTYSLFIAAYFALVSGPLPAGPGHVPTVWAINRTWLTDYLDRYLLNKVPDSKARKSLERSWLDPRDYELFRRLFIKRDPRDKLIKGLEQTHADFVAVLNTFKTNERVLVQQGVFLAGTNVKKSFHELLRRMDGWKEQVVQIQITDGAHDILARLYRAGVNRATLSPGLQGFSESLGPKIPTYREVNHLRRPNQKRLMQERTNLVLGLVCCLL